MKIFSPATFAFGAVFALFQLGPSTIITAKASGLDRQFGHATTENDLYAMNGDDRHYTNGLGFGWLSAPVENPWTFEKWLADLSPPSEVSPEYRRALSVQQLIFTPEDITAREPIYDDRPYAGWLFGRAQLEIVRREEDGSLWQDKFGLELGTTGPSSLARDTQYEWHRMIGIQEPEGWDNQLKNEVAFNLTYQRAYRTTPADLGPFEADLIPYGMFSAGTANSFLGIGGRFRLSNDLPDDMGPTKLYPSTVGSDWYAADGFSWYLFGGPEARAVWRDMFLQGTLFRSSMSVDTYAAVTDFVGGIAAIWGPVRINYQYIWRSKNFTDQTNPDKFGSLTMDIAF